MPSMPKRFSKNKSKLEDNLFEIEVSDPEDAIACRGQDKGLSLYDKALRYEERRAFEYYDLHTIAEEIKIRLKITQQEIFKIGQLLNHAKKLCQKKGLKFMDWVEQNCAFSYETGNNYMNVYQYCFGLRHLAMKIPISILYRISKHNFPENLRQFLFEKGNLENEKMTNIKLTGILKRFREGGFEAIQQDVETVNDSVLMHRQVHFNLALTKNALATLQSLHEKMPSLANVDIRPAGVPEPGALKVLNRLKSTLQNCITTLEKAIKESLADTANTEQNIIDRYLSDAPPALSAKPN